MIKPSIRPTQKELAKALGISQSTVSMALRGDAMINPKTREDVQRAAREMGYHPNASGTSLAHLRQLSKVRAIDESLAWLNAWQEPEKLRRYREFDLYWEGASQEAAARGYRLDEFVVSREMPLSRIARILHTRNVRGIVLPPGPLPEGWQDFDWEAFPVVRLTRLSQADPLSACTVASDQAGSAATALHRIHDKGYRRIGFVANSNPRRAFVGGFMGCQHQLPEGMRLPPLLVPADGPNNWESQFRTWLTRHRPDAILTDVVAVPAILQGMGLKIPRDLGLAALGILDCPINAGIDQNPREVGRLGLQVLHSMIKEGEPGLPKIHRELLIKGTWVDGDSLPERVAIMPREKKRSSERRLAESLIAVP